MVTFPNEETSGGMFVLTNVEMPKERLPFVIHEDVVLRRACAEEVALLEKALEDTYGFLGSHKAEPTAKYKGHLVSNKDGQLTLTGEGYEGESRFWVVAYHGVNDRNRALKLAGLLINPQLYFDFTYICHKPDQQGCTGCIIGNNMPISRFRSDMFEQHRSIEFSEMERFRDFYCRIQVDRSAPERAEELLGRYLQTFKFDMVDAVLVLLYTGIIESIITHAPDPKDPTDSLSRQVSAKMELVRNRFDRDIKPESYFTKNKEQLPAFTKTWKDLYGIRSTIIHGGHVSFERGSSSKFENITLINKYLHDNIRELIKLYFKEPLLLQDLRNC